MRTRASERNVGLFGNIVLGAGVLLMATGSAMAQTTVSIHAPKTHMVHATIRGGSYANRNITDVLETRASSNLEYVRRTLLKFDTENTIPSNASVTSAILTMTVRNGSEDASRRIGAYQIRTSWTESETTWKLRRSGQYWGTAGGDLGSLLYTTTAGNATGSKVSFDVTPLVKAAVTGQLGASRYTRVALVDLDGSSSASYRSYYLPTESNSALRPVLKVTYGGSAPPPPDPTTGSLLRVLHWNAHHNGVRTDGRLDMDGFITWVAKFRPDVVSLNEVHRNSGYCSCDGPARFAQLLSSKTGRTWYYKFATKSGSSSGEGVMLLSRFPFSSTGSRLLSYDRVVVNATINVNGRSVNLFSTHLDADSSSRRYTQIGQIKSWASGIAEQRIVAGDFNAWPSLGEISEMKETYYDSWAAAASMGTATSFPGNDGDTRGSRIDYIFHSKSASRLVLKSSQVFDTRDSSGVMASDHRPLLSVYEVR